MLLSDLEAELAASDPGAVLEVSGDPGTAVRSVTNDSRSVSAGALYCCIAGATHDGHDFAADAVTAGATALLVERPVDVPVPQLRVRSARAAMAPAAAAVHGHPSRQLEVVGITGTNGKTTTAHLVASILEASGRPTKVFGTMTGPRTTPEAGELQGALASWRDGGGRAVAMEVSSAGLAARRVDATWFAAAVFTNLGTDHLDDHGDVESYFEAKATLFDPARTAIGIVNADDERGRALLRRSGPRWVPYSLADASSVELELAESRFTWRGARLRVGLGGVHNVSNAVAAAATAAELGAEVDAVAEGLAAVRGVKGHAEVVDAGQPFSVVVDYAHTPEALAAVLAAGRQQADPSGRVIVVFGCGGDRDPSKRPQMGEAAAAGADVAVVTSDNPRTEDPSAIIDAVVAGMPPGSARIIVEPDRDVAIAIALAEAVAGDVVVVAGKGHERGQVIGITTHPFDDAEVVRRHLASGRGANR